MQIRSYSTEGIRADARTSGPVMSYDKLSDAAAAAVVWALIADAAKENKDAARSWLTERMGPELLAAKAIANGNDVGRVTWVEGKPKPVVTDAYAFLNFVARHYPTEIIRTVNPAFQKALLGNATVVDDALIDSNGVPIPGVEIRTPDPYVSVRKDPAARAVVESLLGSGQLGLDGITQPQIEAP